MKAILDVYPDEQFLKADGFDDCIIGICHRYGQPLLLAYDEEKVIKKLMKRDKMTRQDALEFYTYNIIGSWDFKHGYDNNFYSVALTGKSKKIFSINN